MRGRRFPVGISLLLLVYGLFAATPLLYTISTAFKPMDEMFLFPPRFWVRRPTLDELRASSSRPCPARSCRRPATSSTA